MHLPLILMKLLLAAVTEINVSVTGNLTQSAKVSCSKVSLTALSYQVPLVLLVPFRLGCHMLISFPFEFSLNVAWVWNNFATDTFQATSTRPSWSSRPTRRSRSRTRNRRKTRNAALSSRIRISWLSSSRWRSPTSPRFSTPRPIWRSLKIEREKPKVGHVCLASPLSMWCHFIVSLNRRF